MIKPMYTVQSDLYSFPPKTRTTIRKHPSMSLFSQAKILKYHTPQETSTTRYGSKHVPFSKLHHRPSARMGSFRQIPSALQLLQAPHQLIAISIQHFFHILDKHVRVYPDMVGNQVCHMHPTYRLVAPSQFEPYSALLCRIHRSLGHLDRPFLCSGQWDRYCWYNNGRFVCTLLNGVRGSYFVDVVWIELVLTYGKDVVQFGKMQLENLSVFAKLECILLEYSNGVKRELTIQTLYFVDSHLFE